MQDQRPPIAARPADDGAPGGKTSDPARKRFDQEIANVRRTARAEGRDPSAAERRLIDSIEREARLAVAQAEARERTRPLRAAVADEQKRRRSAIDAQIGATARELFPGKSPAEIQEMLERLARDGG